MDERLKISTHTKVKKLNFLRLATIALTAMLIATPAKAQQMVWGTATNTSAAGDVATNGTYFDAALLQDPTPVPSMAGTTGNGGKPLTVNGVVFNIIAHGNVATDSCGDITLTSNRNPLTAGAVNSDYDTLLTDNEYAQNTTQTIKLSNLTIGNTYQVQVWSVAVGGGAFVTDLNGSNTVALNANPGQFAIGTFTATATTFSFTAVNDAASVNKVNILNAISVFDEGAKPAAPPAKQPTAEPGTATAPEHPASGSSPQ